MQARILFLLTLFISFFQTTLGQGKFRESQLWMVNHVESINEKGSKDQEETHYFNYNPVIDISTQESIYKNVLTEYFSIFVVFRANNESNTPIVALSTKKKDIQITSSFANLEGGITFDQSNPSNGMILSYKGRLENFSRKNHLSFKDFFKEIAVDNKNNHLIEVLYFPNILNAVQTSNIESYLSIKYGINLIGEREYISASRDTLWSGKDHREFNYRVTGIGRDDSNKLYQKQSANYLNPEISLGLSEIAQTNAKNTAELENETFLLWGDNNKSITFPSITKQTINSIERVWKMKTTSSNSSHLPNLEIKLDSTFLNNNTNKTDYPLWLALSNTFEEKFNFENAKLYSSSLDDSGNTRFNNIVLDNNNNQATFFTFFKAAPFFAQSKIATSCNIDNEVNLTIHGGQPPFNIHILDRVNETINEREYDFSLESGYYTLKITDKLNQEFIEELVINDNTIPNITLPQVWELDSNNQARVIPIVNFDNKSNFTYTWYEEDTVLSNTLQHTFTNEGHYELEVVTSSGCETRYPIEITRNALTTDGADQLFPNPVEKGNPFTLNIDLTEPSEITIRLFTVTGQLIHSEEISKTSSLNYQDSILSAGSYFISVTTNRASKTYKILVR